MTGYIREMRKLVGQRPIIQCGASVIIMNSKKEFLLLKRIDNNCWCFPGGSAELGEQIEETAIRETKEETGLDIHFNDLQLLHVFSGKELYYKYPNGDEVYNVDIVYLVKTYSGDIILDDENKEFDFFSIEEFPQEISPPVVPVVNFLKQKFYNQDI